MLIPTCMQLLYNEQKFGKLYLWQVKASKGKQRQIKTDQAAFTVLKLFKLVGSKIKRKFLNVVAVHERLFQGQWGRISAFCLAVPDCCQVLVATLLPSFISSHRHTCCSLSNWIELV